MKKIENVSVVSSIYALAPEEMAEQLSLAIKWNLPQLKAYANNGYVLYTLMIETESESAEEGILLQNVRDTLKKYFGDKYYITGMAQAVNDLSVVTPNKCNHYIYNTNAVHTKCKILARTYGCCGVWYIYKFSA